MKDIIESADFRNKALLALLMFHIRSAQGAEEENNPKARSLEALLHLCGFSNKEITQMTGTPKSTVSDRLRAEGLT